MEIDLRRLGIHCRASRRSDCRFSGKIYGRATGKAFNFLCRIRSFTFPEWFKSEYREQYENFVTNKERLTTPFDVHATLEDILSE
jgi:Protein of unknown function (DUF229)